MTYKFRCWDSVEKVMIDWLTLNQTAFNRGDYPLLYRMFNSPYLFPMLYSGHTDKEGKEIYEGDLFGNNNTRSLVFRDETGAFMIRFLNPIMKGKIISILDPIVSRSKVIGNMYENNDLYETKK